MCPFQTNERFKKFWVAAPLEKGPELKRRATERLTKKFEQIF